MNQINPQNNQPPQQQPASNETSNDKIQIQLNQPTKAPTGNQPFDQEKSHNWKCILTPEWPLLDTNYFRDNFKNNDDPQFDM
ncbi:unnamed protein product [Paramecium octaurelia]|uniref:Uncharacterized protein n=1 Tax=Paramecium octaurelia TaxID=43137 RepID=A0A8S1WLZ7_PAROT|nr:unnamed protein product [Paramecium octaurelia]